MRTLSLIGVTMIALLAIIPSSSAAIGCDPATVPGTAGNDIHLEGSTGDDVIDALAGVDWVTAFGGDDRLCLGPGGSEAFLAEIAWGGGGEDRLLGGRGHDNLRPGPGNDTANGQAGPDYLGGSAGRDRMLGGSGFDDVFGGRGNDVVRGGAGSDRVNGGKGTDACFGTRSDRFIDCETVNGEPT